MLVSCRNLRGELRIVASKSMAHRYMMLSFLSGSKSEDIMRCMNGADMPDDLAATMDCIKALERHGSASGEEAVLNCRDSGTTLRMMMPVAAVLGRRCRILRGKSLASRPIGDLTEELAKHGVSVAEDDDGTLHQSGRLAPGEYAISGKVSSQFTSGLLVALGAAEGRSVLRNDSRPGSWPYIEMTAEMMRRFGAALTVCSEEDGSVTYSIAGNGYVHPTEDERENIIEGDWSAGAMLLAANEILGGSLRIGGLREDSIQGDRRITEIIEGYRRNNGETMTWDVSDIPDIVPAIALLAVNAGCRTEIVNAGRLRYKECDRLAAITDVLASLGADVTEGKDRLVINGCGGRRLPGTDVIIDVRGDHRMVMLAALASAMTERPVRISEPEAVNKSYPGFFEEIVRLGGNVTYQQ